MRTSLNKLCRPLVVALALGVWTAPAAEARWPFHRPTAAAVAPEPHAMSPQRDPVIGVIAIAAGIALFVLLAWIAVRIGDSGR